MQKWSPEPFAAETEAAAPPESRNAFAADADADDGAPGLRFRAETGFNNPDTVMNHLTRQERALVCELLEIDVARDYERKEAALRAELAADHAAEISRLEEGIRTWSGNFARDREDALRDLAAACARLSLQLADKIVRRRVAEDPGVLQRALETVLFGMGNGTGLTVTVHPDEAAWLDADEALKERLQIGRVVADRRVSPGGCRVTADDREWDATLESQLAVLGEIIDEWITTAADRREDGSGDDPGLD